MWLIPQRVLVGAHPEGTTEVAQILAVGVNVFISLTEFRDWQEEYVAEVRSILEQGPPSSIPFHAHPNDACSQSEPHPFETRSDCIEEYVCVELIGVSVLFSL